ncbi:nuclear transport factor 2 family protein [Gordonia hydrophobica]|uniref:Nuclear transport factor 2 family protein n=1 Tax=Gordonia hydrophobica TaxID=40516 RepID=A0ABZ2U7E9_9ACTN|nr:nuclear transport factor 2 family protein [Gordonia hydrophobica]MBM7365402.1 3-phenylpropionate/cinnamic acid dioxygenase small subunit [Gordonia hydrophobica]
MTKPGAGEWREPETVDDLLALAQINAVLVAYCQGVDRRDWDQVLSCYHEDAYESHGQYVGGPTGFVDWLRTNHEHVVSSMHVLSNVTIKLSATHPGFARAESYCLSNKTVASTKADTFFSSVGTDDVLRRTVAVRYIDTLQERPGVGWRILRRDVAFEWVRREPNEHYFPLTDAMDNSRRDEGDLWFSPLAIPGNDA